MKAPLNSILNYLLVLTAGVLGLLLVAGLVLMVGWPWWVGVPLMLLFIGVALGGLSLRRVWGRRQEQHFAQEAGERELAKSKTRSLLDSSAVGQMEKDCKAAVETLRRSQLRRLGNPLYVLPWFLVIGPNRAGKSTALGSARVPSPIDTATRGAEPSATGQAEWWFLERAVYIDTAGRYVTPAQAQDKQEWQKLLSLLCRYRNREPLSGLVVAMAADRLLEADVVQLEKDGCAIRQRIDDLMRATGVKIPTYILITKCDLIPGFLSMCRKLPAKSLDHTMGDINRDPVQEPSAFVDGVMQKMVERLRDLRLQLMQVPGTGEDLPGLLILPEEFACLKSGLTTFTTHACGANPYQETPMVRGIYFGSGRQEGDPHPHAFVTASPMETPVALPEPNKGLFLHDLFAAVLPADRLHLAPTRRSARWRQLTGSLALTSWVVLGFAMCGLLTFSFVKNMTTLRSITHVFPQTVAQAGATAVELETMERYRQNILKVERHNRDWWLPRFGLTESLNVEQGLKKLYCRRFQQLLLIPANKELTTGLAAVGPASPDDIYGQYLMHLVRRINLLKASIHGKGVEVLQAYPQPDFFFITSPPSGTHENTNTFGLLYRSFLAWSSDPVETRKQIVDLQYSLKQLMAVKGGSLQWSAAWVDRRSSLPGVKLEEFWGGSQIIAGEKTVAPAFTRKGKEAVDGLITELEAALPSPATVNAQKAAFAAWHHQATLEAWRSFAADFSKGAERLRVLPEWQQAASRMSTGKGSYFALLDRMTRELELVAREAPQPAWLQQLASLQAVRLQSRAVDNATVGKVTEGGKELVAAIGKNLGQAAGAERLEAQLAIAKACREYGDALAAITPSVGSRNHAFELTARTFGEDPTTGKSPCYSAAAAAARLKAAISGPAADPVFSQLVSGPHEFLWAYLRIESAAHLQSLWEEQVLGATVGMTDQQATPALLGAEGLVWRFVKGPAAPFLTRSVSGYRAKETLGGGLAIEPALFDFMAKGARTQATIMAMGRPQNFSVVIKGLPTDSNSEARMKPQATRLDVQCGSTIQSLVNNNYPVAKTISWSPDACSDVTLQIEVGDVVLTRHYLGQQGFPEFLKDLRGGRRTFTTREFPGEKAALERMGVKSVTVNYQLIGSAAVLKQASNSIVRAPRIIARAWVK